jgi:hypothetical protein
LTLPPSSVRDSEAKETHQSICDGALQKRGRKFKLSSDHTETLVNAAVVRRAKFKIVDLAWTIEQVEKLTDDAFSPTLSWASKFWEKRGWKSLRATHQSKVELDPSIQPAAKSFVEEVNAMIQEFQLSPHHVWYFEETGVWNGAASLRTLVDPNTKDTKVCIEGDMTRDTLVVAINQDGSTFNMGVEHTDDNPDLDESPYARKRVHGAGLTEMINFATQFTAEHPEGGIIIQDNLRCHRNPKVLDIWSAGGFQSMFMPPYSAKFVSPLDNSVFSAIKAHLRKEDTSTTRKKFASCRRVLRNLPPDVIRNCFQHCGYIPNVG